jgi:DNA-directed RNA polymerase subunit alpha
MSEAVEEVAVLAERLTEPDLDLLEMLRIKAIARQNRAERQTVERIQREFEDKYASALGSAADVRRGLIAWALRDLDAARTIWQKASSQAEATFLLGCLEDDAGNLDQAVELLHAAAGSLADATPARSRQIEILLRQGKLKAAEKLLTRLEKRLHEHPDALYLRGFVHELKKAHEDALNAYQGALEMAPDNAASAFRMAYVLDLYGEDERAMSLYQRCGSDSGSYVGAQMNLGLLHDDRDEYHKAMACFKEVLRLEPNNAQARLHFKNAEASIDMYYDEVQRKEQERVEAILRTPITDFEFSVRSRNCLTKMNIKTLGDLIHKTEAEMLAYKNFGETSLREIKEILDTKGLHLGMTLEPDDKKKQKERLRSLASIDSDSEMLMRPVTDLELSVRSRKAMGQLDIQTIGDLVTHTEAELIALKNFGQTSLNELKQKLDEHSLTLKPMDV